MEFDKDDDRQAHIAELRQSNAERILALAQVRTAEFPQGVQIQINRESAVIEFILDHLCSTSDERLEFERTQAQGIADQLDNIESQIRQQNILAGVAGVNPSDLNRAECRQIARANNGH